jgi:hypothetical protein
MNCAPKDETPIKMFHKIHANPRGGNGSGDFVGFFLTCINLDFGS